MRAMWWLGGVAVVVTLACCSPVVSLCEGRVLCSDEPLNMRVCLLVEPLVDLQHVPELDVYLTNTHPASLRPGALSLAGCHKSEPLLSNAFGTLSSSKVYGEMEVAPGGADDCADHLRSVCVRGRNPTDALQCVMREAGQVTVMVNRDMTGNVFHILYNTMFPLFRAKQHLGIDFASNRTCLLMIDPMPLSAVELELFVAVMGGDSNRIDRSSLAELCYSALVVGVSRHWRSWLHSESKFGELVPFVGWLKGAFQISKSDEEEAMVITLVNRRGTRAIINMDELVEALQVAAPNAIVLSQAFELLSLSEQLKLVARSRVLIAVHGAALGFLPFVDPATGGSIVELLPYGFADADFYGHLARAAGVSHVALPANASLQPQSVIDAAAPMESGLMVDIEQVVAAVTGFASE